MAISCGHPTQTSNEVYSKTLGEIHKLVVKGNVVINEITNVITIFL